MFSQEMILAIGDSLSNFASSDNGEDEEHEDDDDTGQSQQCEDDKPGLVILTITKTVLQCMGRFHQEQMMLDKLTQQDGRTQPIRSIKEMTTMGHLN